MKTKERLARVLRQHGLQQMAEHAAQGYYDDFESPLAMPITRLVEDLKARGFHQLAQRAMNGEWDSTPTESEEWFARFKEKK